MRKTSSLALLLVALGVSPDPFAPFATAQPGAAAAPSSAVRVTAPLQIDRLPPAVIPFNDGWLYRPGDNLAWADPASSDAGWQPVTLDKQSPSQKNAWHWYRIRIYLPAGHPPLALLLAPVDTGGFETYVNGHRAGDASQPNQRRTGEKVGRNDPCPCGSGKKYKKCHGAE
jgi:hypothetical protein